MSSPRELPAGYIQRPAAPGDEEDVVAAVNLSTREMIDADWLTVEELAADHRTAGFEPDRDTRVVVSPDDEIVAYAALWAVQDPPVHPYLFVRVRPDHRGRGIGSALTQWGLRRAGEELRRVRADARVSVYCSCPEGFTPAADLLRSLLFGVCRHSFEMRIDLDEPLPEPAAASGVRIRGYRHPDELEAVARTAWKAFRDHRGAVVDEPFESYFSRFRCWLVEMPDFDPTLWLLAAVEDEIVAILVGDPYHGPDRESGYVPILGVLPEYRRRGIALALLRTAFGEFRRRGRRAAALHVDAESLTGAVALYERAGMRVVNRFDTWERELRPGRELGRGMG
jgi:mycothiol synthase